MSINVFKNHPGNKITFSDRFVLYGKLKVVGSRLKVIFCVHGARQCRTYDTLFIVNKVSPRGGGSETICLPPTAVGRWQKSRRIYVRQRTGRKSAHLWWPVVAKLQAASVPIA